MQRLTDSSILPLHTLKEHTCHTAANALYLSLSQCWRGHLVSSYGCAGVPTHLCAGRGCWRIPACCGVLFMPGKSPPSRIIARCKGKVNPPTADSTNRTKRPFSRLGRGLGRNRQIGRFPQKHKCPETA